MMDGEIVRRSKEFRSYQKPGGLTYIDSHQHGDEGHDGQACVCKHPVEIFVCIL